jgi:hypothetical protein
VYATVRARIGDPGALARPFHSIDLGHGSAVLDVLRATDDLVRARLEKAYDTAAAARWIDALPIQVDARSGGFSLAVRLRAP